MSPRLGQMAEGVVMPTWLTTAWLILKLAIKWGPSIFALVEEFVKLIGQIKDSSTAETHALEALSILSDAKLPRKERHRRLRALVERLRIHVAAKA